MKFSINQAELLNALTIVSKGVSQRATLPVLAGIFIETDGDFLVFQSTNQELSIKYRTAALIEEDGSTVLPGKLLIDIVKSLEDAAVSITADEAGAKLWCDKSSFTLGTLNPQDFPGFPDIEASYSVSLPFETFSRMVKQVSRATAKDNSRPILTGILMDVTEGAVKMVATDSYRLAVSEVLTETRSEFNAVIAGGFMQDLAGLKKSEEEITVGLSENQIIVKYNDAIYINRRIEGRYPNYKQLLPNSHTTLVEAEVARLVSSVKRVSLINTALAQLKFSFSPEEEELVLSNSAQDIGSAEESLSIQGTGEKMDIGFNSAYLIDGLQVMPSEKVLIELQSPLKPGVFKATEPFNFLYLVMPVRIS